jgi:hypothetical protein
MSRFSAHVTGESNPPRVTRDDKLAAFNSERGEFHATTISFGSLTVNLTDREARRLWEDLGEIYASQTPGEVETPEQIAERISSQRSIGGYSGIDPNTRRIVRGAVLQAAKAARGLKETTPFITEDTRRLDPKPFRNGGPETKSERIFPGSIFHPGIDFNQDTKNYPDEIFSMSKEGDQ